MATGDFHMVRLRYQQLHQQYHAGKISWEQLTAEVGKLQFQDERGVWWAVDPRNGAFLRFDGAQWVPGSPPVESEVPASTAYSQPAKASQGKGCLYYVSILGVFMPLITAFLWFAYTSLTPSSEGWDVLTPLILACVPIGLLMFQKRVDRLLLPIQPVRKKFPKPVLLGAALAIPAVISLIMASRTYAGYGAMRSALIIGMLSAHAITRDPEVEP